MMETIRNIGEHVIPALRAERAASEAPAAGVAALA